MFGCTAFTHVHSHLRGKLDPRAIKCVFIGYSPIQKECKCYDPSTKRVFVSLDVTFFENTPFFKKSSLREENLSEDRSLKKSLTLISPERTRTEQVMSNMPCTKENLNTGGDVEKQSDKEILVYFMRLNSKYKGNLTPEAPKESESVIGPNKSR